MSWRRAATVRWQRVGDEVVLLDLASREYFQLDAVGAFAWEHVEELDAAALAREISARWEVDEAAAAADLDALVAELAAAGLLLAAGDDVAR